MGKLIPFLFIALDGKSAVAHLRLRIPGHKLRGSWFSFRWSPVYGTQVGRVGAFPKADITTICPPVR
ncbi:hypothetical protein CIPOMM044M_22115 [Citrobacter portucalensis]